MLKDLRFAILKLRETYNRKMWHYCIGRSKYYECCMNEREKSYWEEEANSYLKTQQFITDRLRKI